MLDGEETVQVACGELRWRGARQHSSRGNGLGRAQCRAVSAAFSELLARFFFRTNFIIAIVVKEL